MEIDLMSSATTEKLSQFNEDYFTAGSTVKISNSADHTAPDFEKFDKNLHAQSIKNAGRLNASAISEAEHQQLLDSRQNYWIKSLLMKLLQKN